MSGHTLGPWRWKWEPRSHTLDYPHNAPDVYWDGESGDEAGRPYESEYSLDFDRLEGPDGASVVFGRWHNDDTAGVGVSREDARLIAAAPELLEACKTIVYAYENADAAPEALDRAYAAIAKAEGVS